jgi:hypothetical protein
MTDAEPPSFWERAPTWFAVLVFLGTTYFSITGLVLPGLAPRHWNVPEKHDLIWSSGTLTGVSSGRHSSYSFATKAGQVISFYCDPYVKGSQCIQTSGFNINNLTGKAATAGYFVPHDDSAMSYGSNIPVLMSLTVGNNDVLSFQKRRLDLQGIATFEDGQRNLGGEWVSVLGAVFLIGVTASFLYLNIAAHRRGRVGRSWA